MAERASADQDSPQKTRTADNEGGSSSTTADQQPATNHDQKAADSSTGEKANKSKKTNKKTAVEEEEEEEEAAAEESAREGDEAEEGVEETEEEGQEEEDVQKDNSAAAAGESAPHALRKRIIKRPLEYALTDMYPEVNILIERKRQEWDYQDPDLIRALWLEARTNALAEWKVSHAIVAKRKKPLLEVQQNNAFKLRRQRLDTLKEQLQSQQIKEERMYNRPQPEFAEVKLATNLTTQIRYNYTRNNPPVPHYFLAHYEKFKKPPFLTYGLGSKACKLRRRPSR